MDNFGFIHEELDIKIFLLYILSRLSGPIEIFNLFDICKCDDGVGYFDFSQCLNDLIDNENVSVTEDEDSVVITEKGRKNSAAVENDLPYSVRTKADKYIEAADEKIVRSNLVRTDYITEDGCSHVVLSLSDGVGEIMNLRMLCADENQARTIRRNYKKNAERYFNLIISMLSE